MTVYDGVQAAIVGGAVVFSALYAVGKVAPGLRRSLGNKLGNSRYPRWLNAVGAKLGGTAAGCGSDCSSCGSCDAAPRTTKTDLVKIAE